MGGGFYACASLIVVAYVLPRSLIFLVEGVPSSFRCAPAVESGYSLSVPGQLSLLHSTGRMASDLGRISDTDRLLFDLTCHQNYASNTVFNNR